MGFEVLKNEKNSLQLKFDNVDQGLLNAIRTAVWEDSSVDAAGFNIDHLQVGNPVFFLETKGKAAKQVWNSTIDKLSKQSAELEKSLKSLK